MRILMIEDDRDISGLVSKTVEAAFAGELVTVECVASLAKANQSLRERVYDVILLDVVLPDGNGLQWLRYQPVIQRQRVPVIVLSSGNHVGSVLESMDFGADHFLEKSLTNLARLPDLIDECIEERAPYTPDLDVHAA